MAQVSSTDDILSALAADAGTIGNLLLADFIAKPTSSAIVEKLRKDKLSAYAPKTVKYINDTFGINLDWFVQFMPFYIIEQIVIIIQKDLSLDSFNPEKFIKDILAYAGTMIGDLRPLNVLTFSPAQIPNTIISGIIGITTKDVITGYKTADGKPYTNNTDRYGNTYYSYLDVTTNKTSYYLLSDDKESMILCTDKDGNLIYDSVNKLTPLMKNTPPVNVKFASGAVEGYTHVPSTTDIPDHYTKNSTTPVQYFYKSGDNELQQAAVDANGNPLNIWTAITGAISNIDTFDSLISGTQTLLSQVGNIATNIANLPQLPAWIQSIAGPIPSVLPILNSGLGLITQLNTFTDGALGNLLMDPWDAENISECVSRFLTNFTNPETVVPLVTNLAQGVFTIASQVSALAGKDISVITKIIPGATSVINSAFDLVIKVLDFASQDFKSLGYAKQISGNGSIYYTGLDGKLYIQNSDKTKLVESTLNNDGTLTEKTGGVTVDLGDLNAKLFKNIAMDVIHIVQYGLPVAIAVFQIFAVAFPIITPYVAFASVMNTGIQVVTNIAPTLIDDLIKGDLIKFIIDASQLQPLVDTLTLALSTAPVAQTSPVAQTAPVAPSTTPTPSGDQLKVGFSSDTTPANQQGGGTRIAMGRGAAPVATPTPVAPSTPPPVAPSTTPTPSAPVASPVKASVASSGTNNGQLLTTNALLVVQAEALAKTATDAITTATATLASSIATATNIFNKAPQTSTQEITQAKAAYTAAIEAAKTAATKAITAAEQAAKDAIGKLSLTSGSDVTISQNKISIIQVNLTKDASDAMTKVGKTPNTPPATGNVTLDGVTTSISTPLNSPDTNQTATTLIANTSTAAKNYFTAEKTSVVNPEISVVSSIVNITVAKTLRNAAQEQFLTNLGQRIIDQAWAFPELDAIIKKCQNHEDFTDGDLLTISKMTEDGIGASCNIGREIQGVDRLNLQLRLNTISDTKLNIEYATQLISAQKLLNNFPTLISSMTATAATLDTEKDFDKQMAGIRNLRTSVPDMDHSAATTLRNNIQDKLLSAFDNIGRFYDRQNGKNILELLSGRLRTDKGLVSDTDRVAFMTVLQKCRDHKELTSTDLATIADLSTLMTSNATNIMDGSAEWGGDNTLSIRDNGNNDTSRGKIGLATTLINAQKALSVEIALDEAIESQHKIFNDTAILANSQSYTAYRAQIFNNEVAANYATAVTNADYKAALTSILNPTTFDANNYTVTVPDNTVTPATTKSYTYKTPDTNDGNSWYLSRNIDSYNKQAMDILEKSDSTNEEKARAKQYITNRIKDVYNQDLALQQISAKALKEIQDALIKKQDAQNKLKNNPNEQTKIDAADAVITKAKLVMTQAKKQIKDNNTLLTSTPISGLANKDTYVGLSAHFKKVKEFASQLNDQMNTYNDTMGNPAINSAALVVPLKTLLNIPPVVYSNSFLKISIADATDIDKKYASAESRLHLAQLAYNSYQITVEINSIYPNSATNLYKLELEAAKTEEKYYKELQLSEQDGKALNIKNNTDVSTVNFYEINGKKYFYDSTGTGSLIEAALDTSGQPKTTGIEVLDHGDGATITLPSPFNNTFTTGTGASAVTYTKKILPSLEEYYSNADGTKKYTVSGNKATEIEIHELCVRRVANTSGTIITPVTIDDKGNIKYTSPASKNAAGQTIPSQLTTALPSALQYSIPIKAYYTINDKKYFYSASANTTGEGVLMECELIKGVATLKVVTVEPIPATPSGAPSDDTFTFSIDGQICTKKILDNGVEYYSNADGTKNYTVSSDNKATLIITATSPATVNMNNEIITYTDTGVEKSVSPTNASGRLFFHRVEAVDTDNKPMFGVDGKQLYYFKGNTDFYTEEHGTLVLMNKTLDKLPKFYKISTQTDAIPAIKIVAKVEDYDSNTLKSTSTTSPTITYKIEGNYWKGSDGELYRAESVTGSTTQYTLIKLKQVDGKPLITITYTSDNNTDSSSSGGGAADSKTIYERVDAAIENSKGQRVTLLAAFKENPTPENCAKVQTDITFLEQQKQVILEILRTQLAIASDPSSTDAEKASAKILVDIIQNGQVADSNAIPKVPEIASPLQAIQVQEQSIKDAIDSASLTASQKVTLQGGIDKAIGVTTDIFSLVVKPILDFLNLVIISTSTGSSQQVELAKMQQALDTGMKQTFKLSTVQSISNSPVTPSQTPAGQVAH